MYQITDARTFLSGNLNDKIEATQEAKLHDESFDRELQALHKAMPPWIEIAEVAQFGVSIGVTWIPARYYEEFCLETFGVRVKFYYSEACGSWEMQLLSTIKTDLNMGEWGYKYDTFNQKGNPVEKTFPAIGETLDAGLFTMALHFKTPKIRIPNSGGKDGKLTAEVRAKQDAIKQAWTEWCMNGPAAEELEKLYNHQLNQKVLRSWDNTGDIVIPQLKAIGCSQKWLDQLRPYQLDAIWRGCVDVKDKNGILIGLEVGLGKTPVIAATIMLRRHYKTCTKAMVVVQKSTLLQFDRTFREMFPKAKVLCATPEDCNGENRQEFLARAAYWDWDAIILTHESFRAIPVKPSTEAKYVERTLADIERELEFLYAMGESAKGKKGKKGYKGNRVVKRLEEMRNRELLRLRELSVKRDQGIYFEDIAPLLVIDEAQVYKNDAIATKLQVPGIGTADSDRARDFHLKLSFLEDRYKQGFLLLSTGTPEPTNSISGIFAMQRYLQPQVLRRSRMTHFDAWISNFGRVTVEPEAKIDGEIRLTERLKEFVNLPELLQMWLDVCHVKRFEDVKGQGNFERPEMKLKRVCNYMTDFQLETMQSIQYRYSAIMAGNPRSFFYTDREGYLLWTPEGAKKRVRVVHPVTEMPIKMENSGEAVKLRLKIDTKIDSYILCYSDARKLMIAPQLIDPEEEIRKYDKVHRCARRLLRWWKITKEEKAVQLVFLDMGTPGGDAKFYIYEWLKNWLIERGVPEKEIAFIQQCKDDEDKEALFVKVNAGEVRILIGSTSPMGIGVNVQDRVKVMHLLDIPRRPDEFEQRLGRGVRSGNTYSKVLVYQYLVQGKPSQNYGADAAQFTMLENKIKMRQSVLRGDPSVRRIVEDDDQQSIYMMLVAHATGDPGVMEYMKLGVELEKLKNASSLLQREITKLRSKKENSIDEARKNALALRSDLDKIAPDVEIVRELKKSGFLNSWFAIEIEGEVFFGADLERVPSLAGEQGSVLAGIENHLFAPLHLCPPAPLHPRSLSPKVLLYFYQTLKLVPWEVATPNKARILANEHLHYVVTRIQNNSRKNIQNGLKQHIGKIGPFNIFCQHYYSHHMDSGTCWIARDKDKSASYGWRHGKTVGIANIEKALLGVPDKAAIVRMELDRANRAISDREEALDKKVEAKKDLLCRINEINAKRSEIQQRLNIKE